MRKAKFFLALIFTALICDPAQAKLVGYWDFNENGGTVVNDTSGSGNNGTFQDGTNFWVAGKYGSGLQFTGNPNGRVLIPDSPSLDLTNSFTIEAWVNPASAIPPSVVVSKYTYPNPMIFNLRTANNSSGVWEFDATQANLWSTTPIPLNKWQHLAVTYDGAKMKLYFNGKLESIVDATGSLNVDDNPVFIGGQGCGTPNCRDPFNGVIDEVRIYNHALNQIEIKADMNNHIPVGQPPVAEAGEDVFAAANSTVVLDGSASSDSDGTIIEYFWTRLPDNVVLCSKSEPTCKVKTLGNAEEMMALDVVDNEGNIARDTISIFHEMPAVCGNGNIEDDEICDGNSISCFNPQGYSGIKYCNKTCSAFGDCITALFCGDGIKNGFEVCDGNTQPCTMTSGYAGTQSCNGQCTGFGACASNLSCGDNVCTAPPETSSNCSQDCTTTIIESFSSPITTQNLKAFGPGNQFTFSLDRNGTFIIDGTSGLAWQKSDSYRDSAIIRSTNPLPQTYKISVVVGDIDYGLEKLAGLQNDPNYPEGPLNENGVYFLSITDELPNVPHTNIWWHQHRKVVIDVDNNIWGQGMPNPVFMVYFDRNNNLVSYDGDQNIWQNQWQGAIHYQANTFYRIEIEKTLQEFILRAFSEDNQLLKEARVNLTEIWHEDGLHQEYFVVGDPHENYYQGSMKIKEITVKY